MSLLHTKHPIVINPDLAESIGLNEAIVLQQLQYWLTETGSGVEHNGKRWVYNTLEQWQKQFPFWSVDTVKRAFTSLQKSGVISVEKLAAKDHNQTNFYTINHDHHALMEQGKMPSSSKVDSPSSEQCNLPRSEQGNLPSSSSARSADVLTETTTETTTEITDKGDNAADAAGLPATISADVKMVFDHWVAVMGKNPKRTELDDNRKRLITKALKNYSVADLKQAIDGCAASQFHMGQNRDKKKYNGLELILRNSEKIEGFRDNAGPHAADAHGGFKPEDYDNVGYMSDGAREALGL